MIEGLAAPFVGSPVRFFASLALLAGFALWLRQNGLWTADALSRETVAGICSGNAGFASLQLPPLPASVTASVSGLGALAAGLVLLISSLSPGVKVSLFAVPAAVVRLGGASFGVPGIGTWAGPETVSAALGAGLAAAGFVFVRFIGD